MSELGQQLIAIVRRKAAENPDFVYLPEGRIVDGEEFEHTCQYIHRDGSPGCLIGQALFEAGLIDASLYERPDNSGAFFDLVDTFAWPIDQREVDWLRRVQWYQDKRRPWGEAAQYADSKVALPA